MLDYTTPQQRWQAVVQRDAKAASAFVFCVRTTGIYCRPNCSARQARRANVEFYDDADGARRAGFRACKRCRPELPSWNPTADTISRACKTIDSLASQGKEIPLSQLAEQSGMTKFHFHRAFKKVTGRTPKEYAKNCKMHKSRGSVLDEAQTNSHDSSPQRPNMFPAVDDPLDWSPFDAQLDFSTDDTGSGGYGSPAEFWEFRGPGTPLNFEFGADNSVEIDGANVALVNEEPDIRLQYTIRESRFGKVMVAFKSAKVCALEMGYGEAELVAELKQLFPSVGVEQLPSASHLRQPVLDGYVDAILEALESPSGKTVSVPFDETFKSTGHYG